MSENLRCTERNINPNISHFKDADLNICVSLQQFRVDLGVYSTVERIPMALASYEFLPSDLSYQENIITLLQAEKLLDPSFHYGSRNFTVQDFKSTLIPEKFYEDAYGKQYIDALFHLNGRECITQETETNTNSRILSAFNANYLSAAQTIFEQDTDKIGFTGIYTRLIQEGYRVSRSFKRFPNHVLLHTRSKEFDLLLVNDGGLQFINSFPYPDFDNLLYYFLYALNKLKIDMGSVALYLCGSASKQNLLPLLEQQVYTITYLPAPGTARFPAEMPYDRFFSCL